MTLEVPNNCWPANLQKVADAVIASAAFQSLVELPGGTADEVGRFVFGKRLTHARSGAAWTVDELADLRFYAMVFSESYGKHLGGKQNYRHYPHGTVSVVLGRLVRDKDLVDHGEGRTGLNDVHDRQWQNIAGSVLDEMLDWLTENGGPYPVLNVEMLGDSETRVENQPTQGIWQNVEWLLDYRVE